MRGFRRRWASGVAVITHRGVDGIRGVTVSGLVSVGVEPPSVLFVLQTEESFHERLAERERVGISILHREQEFIAERFAGRAPLPDTRLSGIKHHVLGESVVLDGAIGAASGNVRSIAIIDDHALVLVEVVALELPPDTDEPMIYYEGTYRDLEPA
jgi:flavin reductase